MPFTFTTWFFFLAQDLSPRTQSPENKQTTMPPASRVHCTSCWKLYTPQREYVHDAALTLCACVLGYGYWIYMHNILVWLICSINHPQVNGIDILALTWSTRKAVLLTLFGAAAPPATISVLWANLSKGRINREVVWSTFCFFFFAIWLILYYFIRLFNTFLKIKAGSPTRSALTRHATKVQTGLLSVKWSVQLSQRRS